MFLCSLEREFPALFKTHLTFILSPLLRAPECIETSTFFSSDNATQQKLSRDATELRTDQIFINGLAILTLWEKYCRTGGTSSPLVWSARLGSNGLCWSPWLSLSLTTSPCLPQPQIWLLVIHAQNWLIKGGKELFFFIRFYCHLCLSAVWHCVFVYSPLRVHSS